MLYFWGKNIDAGRLYAALFLKFKKPEILAAGTFKRDYRVNRCVCRTLSNIWGRILYKIVNASINNFKFFTKQFYLLPPPPHSPNLQNQKIENNSLLESSEFWLNLQNRKIVYIHISFKTSVVSWLTLQGLWTPVFLTCCTTGSHVIKKDMTQIQKTYARTCKLSVFSG